MTGSGTDKWHGGRSTCRRAGALAAAAAAGAALLAPAAAGAACPNEDVRVQQGSQYLPDCRAYEQISPVDKAGYSVGTVLTFSTDAHVSADGQLVSYLGFHPVPGSEVAASPLLSAQRDAAGEWTTSSVFPKSNGATSGHALPDFDMSSIAGTPDQRVHVYLNRFELPGGWLWVRRADGSRQRIAPGSAVSDPSMSSPGTPFVEGVSEDGRHVLFTLTDRIGPAAGLPGTDRILYEWIDDGTNAGQGTLRVVNRTDSPALALLDSGHAALGGGHSAPDRTSSARGLRGAVSADGSRIFFQNPAPPADGATAGPVYLREGGETTIELSAPAAGHVPSGPVSARFLAATRDGSRAFFYADRDLVSGAPADGGLYRYDVGALSPLAFLTSTGQAIADIGIGADDGTRVYYERPDGGSFDVYVNVDGEDRPILSPGDLPGDFGMSAEDLTTVTPDGRYLAFESSSGSTRGTYRYDAVADELTEIGGSRSMFSISAGHWTFPRRMASRAMSDDGRFVFFQTTDPLVERDTNRRSAALNDGWDVYRWSADGGQVELVTDGRTSYDDGLIAHHLAGIDATGSTALVVTSARLARTDRDELWDLYAVRVNGGRLVEDEPAECSGDGCQGDGSGPGLDRAGSGVVRSAGDARPPAAASIRLVGPRGSVRVGSAGRVRVTVRAVRAGRVSAVLRVGGRKIGGAARRASGSGRTVLSLRLSKAGRRALAADGRLRVRLVVRANGQTRARNVVLTASRKPAGQRAGGR